MKILISAISCGLQSAVLSVPVSTILRMVSSVVKIVKKFKVLLHSDNNLFSFLLFKLSFILHFHLGLFFFCFSRR